MWLSSDQWSVNVSVCFTWGLMSYTMINSWCTVNVVDLLTQCVSSSLGTSFSWLFSLHIELPLFRAALTYILREVFFISFPLLLELFLVRIFISQLWAIKADIHSLYDSSLPVVAGVARVFGYQEHWLIWASYFPSIFIVVQLIIAESWKGPGSINKWIDKEMNLYPIEYCSVKDKIELFVGKWMYLETVMLSEIMKLKTMNISWFLIDFTAFSLLVHVCST